MELEQEVTELKEQTLAISPLGHPNAIFLGTHGA